MASLHNMHVNIQVTANELNAWVEQHQDILDQMRQTAEHQANILINSFAPVLALHAMASPRKVSRRELFGFGWWRR